MPKLKVQYTDGAYPVALSNYLVKKAPRIGWEWEIPAPGGYPWELLRGAAPFRAYLASRGHSCHMECGGLEVSSVLYETLGDAKRGAAELASMAAAARGLEPYEGNTSNTQCGIHVNISDRGSLSSHEMSKITGRARRMVYHSEIFMKKLSGRFDMDQRTNVWSVQAYSARSFQHKNHQGCNVLECRVFGPQYHRMDVALEFTQALFFFLQRWRKYREPIMNDFRDYVFKRKGYKTLKAEDAWSLLN